MLRVLKQNVKLSRQHTGKKNEKNILHILAVTE